MPTTFYFLTTSADEPKPNTRLYSGTVAWYHTMSSTLGGGQDTSASVYPLNMSTSSGAASVYLSNSWAESGSSHFGLAKTWITPALVPQTLSGCTITLSADFQEGNTQQNMYPIVAMYKWLSGDSSGSQMFLGTSSLEADTTTGSVQNFTFSSPTVSTTTFSSGDRIYIELDWNDSNTKTSTYTHGLTFGGSGGTSITFSQTFSWPSRVVNTNKNIYTIRKLIASVSIVRFLYHVRPVATSTVKLIHNIKNLILTYFSNIYRFKSTTTPSPVQITSSTSEFSNVGSGGESRSVFYCNGNYFVSLCNGTNVLAYASQAGSSWSNKLTVTCNRAYKYDWFQIADSGTYGSNTKRNYVLMATANGSNNGGNGYLYTVSRTGAITQDSTKTFGLPSGMTYCSYFTMSLDTTGKFWVGMFACTTGAYRPFVSSSSGVWNFTTGWYEPTDLYPSQANNGSAMALHPLSSGKMVIFWVDGNNFYLLKYNGSSWDASPTTVSSTISGAGLHTSVVDTPNDNVYIVYVDTSNNLKYLTWNYSSGLSGETTVKSSATSPITVSMSRRADGRLYLFHSEADRYIYITPMTSGGTWLSEQNIYDYGSDNDLTAVHTWKHCAPYSETSLVAFRMGTASPWVYDAIDWYESGPVSIIKSLILKYNIVSAISVINSFVVKYNIRGIISNLNEIEYNIRNLVNSSTNGIKYHIRNLINAIKNTFKYHIRNIITNAEKTIYHLRGLVSNVWSIKYNILGLILVSASMIFSYNLKTLIGKIQSLSYNTRRKILGMDLWGYWPQEAKIGSTLPDFSLGGDTRKVTIAGTVPALTAGKYGNALPFDGSTNYLYTDGIYNSKPHGFSAWVYFDSSTSNALPAIFEYGTPCTMYFYYLDPSDWNDFCLNVWREDSGGYWETFTWDTPTGWSKDAWHHMVLNIAQDHSYMELFIDKLSKGQKGITAYYENDTNSSFKIGYSPYGGSSQYFWDGYIDEVHLSGTPFTTDEIKRLYDGDTYNKTTREIYNIKNFVSKVIETIYIIRNFVSNIKNLSYNIFALISKITSISYNTRRKIIGMNLWAYWPQEDIIGSTTPDMGYSDSRSLDLFGTSPSLTSGNYGNAIHLNGTDNYFRSQETFDQILLGGFSAWIYMDSDMASTQPRFLGMDAMELHTMKTTSFTRFLFIYYHNPSSKIIDTQYWSNSITPDAWHHVVLNINTSTLKAELFVDTVSQGEKNIYSDYCNNNGLDDVVIGRSLTYDLWYYYYKGYIDEIHISKVPFTTEEIRRMYDGDTYNRTMRPIYTIRNLVSASAEKLIYSIRNIISNITNLVYNIGGIIGKTIKLAYNILSIISSSSALKWSILGLVSSIQTIVYNMRNFVSSIKAISYNILNKITSGFISIYSILSSVSVKAFFKLVYSVRAFVSASIFRPIWYTREYAVTTATYGAGGEGTNAWTTPSNARGLTDDNQYATCVPPKNSSVAGIWTTYGITGVGEITKVEVGVEVKESSDNNFCSVNVEVSYDGGTNWTSAQSVSTSQLTITETLYTLDLTSGRSWTWSELSNTYFQVRVTGVKGSSSTSFTISLDRIPVTITSRKERVARIRKVMYNLAVLNMVSTIVLIKYNLKAFVSSINKLIYTIRAMVTPSSNKVIYNIRAVVSASAEKIIYNIRGLIGKTTALVYNIRNFVSTVTKAIYHILGAISVSTSMIVKYNIRNLIYSARKVVYNVRNFVSKTRTIIYNIRNFIANTRKLIYNIKNLIEKSKALSYNIRNFVSKIKSVSYNIINIVKATRRFIYSIGGAAGAVLHSVYNIWNVVSQRRGFMYNIRQMVSISKVRLIYTIRNFVASTRKFVYNIFNTVSKTIKTIYNIIGRLIKSLTIKYNLRNLVYSTKRFVWNVVAGLLKLLKPVYNIRAMVSPSGEKLVWNIRNLISSTKKLIYNIKNFASKALSIVYGLTGRIQKLFVPLYNIFNLVSYMSYSRVYRSDMETLRSGKLMNFDNPANDGTLNSVTQGVSGVYGNAIRFAGDLTSYVSVPTTGFPTGNSSRTFSAWVKITDYGDNRTAFYYGGLGPSSNMFQFGTTITDGYLALWLYGNDHISTTPVPSGEWHHIAAVIYESTKSKLYLDGQCISTKTDHAAIETGTSQANIGRRSSAAPFKGDIDEARLYSIALSDTEILYLSRGGVPSRITRYKILNFVSASGKTIVYNIRNLIQKGLKTIYNIRNIIFNTVKTIYRILSLVGVSKKMVYNIRQFVSSVATLRYKIFGFASGLLKAVYNIVGLTPHEPDPYTVLFNELYDYLYTQTGVDGDWEGFLIYKHRPRITPMFFPCIVMHMERTTEDSFFGGEYQETAIITFEVWFKKNYKVILEVPVL